MYTILLKDSPRKKKLKKFNKKNLNFFSVKLSKITRSSKYIICYVLLKLADTTIVTLNLETYIFSIITV